MTRPPDAASGPAHGKQFVKFTFYRVRDDVRSRDDAARLDVARCIEELLARSAERMFTRTYSTVGTRADADFMVWQVADELATITDWHAEVLGSPAAAALERRHSFLSMTMRSLYVNKLHPASDGGGAGRERLAEDVGTAAYLFVYPMVKTRAWYRLPREERQRIMDEHIAIGHRYHRIRINTTYSYGLDDQEFVVAFEGDDPGEFLALVRELRESESSFYTERDTPMFTCRRMEPRELLAHAGLPVGT